MYGLDEMQREYSHKKVLILKVYFMFLWYTIIDIPAPGCLICRCLINWNTGRVNDSWFVHLVAETTVWIQHAFITVTVKIEKKFEILWELPKCDKYHVRDNKYSSPFSTVLCRKLGAMGLVLAMASDMCCGWWELATLFHLPSPDCSNSESHLQMEEVWIWDTGYKRTAVVPQQINFALLSHWDLSPKHHGLAQSDPADWFQIVPKHLILLIVSIISGKIISIKMEFYFH